MDRRCHQPSPEMMEEIQKEAEKIFREMVAEFEAEAKLRELEEWIETCRMRPEPFDEIPLRSPKFLGPRMNSIRPVIQKQIQQRARTNCRR